jgi:hypothetical protein
MLYYIINMEYKYYLSLCVCVKNEANHIEDFLRHYVNQGVEHFYIINNNSTDNIQDVIDNSIYKLFVTVITDNRSMIIFDAYSRTVGIPGLLNDNLYQLIKMETEWAITVDIDEYMYGKNGFTIKTFLKTIKEDIGCIYVIWTVMCPNKIENQITNEFSVKKNLKRINYDSINNLSWNIKNCNDFGKSIFRTSMLIESQGIGLHKTQVTGKTINNYGENKNDWYDNCNQIKFSEENYKNINITINHYALRDFSDFSRKKIQYDLNHARRNAFLNGVFEMLDLDDSYLVVDNTINEDVNDIIEKKCNPPLNDITINKAREIITTLFTDSRFKEAKFSYGYDNSFVDVTKKVFTNYIECIQGIWYIHIPKGYYSRDKTLGDPFIGFHKFIKVEINKNIEFYDEFTDIKIPIL